MTFGSAESQWSDKAEARLQGGKGRVCVCGMSGWGGVGGPGRSGRGLFFQDCEKRTLA